MAMIAHHERTYRREKLYVILGIICGLLTIIYSGITKIELESVEWSPLLLVLVSTCRDQAWYSVPILGTLAALFALAKKQVGPSVQLILIHNILNDLHSQIFPRGVSLAENRVTLFKYENEWLHVIERSHHLTRKSRAKFNVPDNGKAQGVAGQCWVTRAPVYVTGLPNISPDFERPRKGRISALSAYRVTVCEYFGNFWFLDSLWRIWWCHRTVTTADVNACEEYARQTWISNDWVIKSKRRKKSLPRVICAIPVEVSGKPWGVIVVDSREEKLISDREINEYYNAHSKSLERILKLL